MSLTTLCTRSMIAYACRLMVVTCSWFGFNGIIVTHLLKLTFEFPYIFIVKDSKLRLRVTFQPGVMKQILDVCWWLICGFDNFQTSQRWFLDLSLWVQAESVFWLVSFLIVNGPTRSTQTMTQGYSVRFCYFGWEQPIFLTLLLCHLTYLTSGT
jgi:hypothetical protein